MIYQKQILENTTLLVKLLYEMCKLQLVEKTDSKEEVNTVNEDEIQIQIENAENLLYSLDSAA